MCKWLKELTSDDGGRASSMRVMMLIGCISGCTALLAIAFGKATVDISGPLSLLFAGIFGGKAAQKFAEQGK